MNLNKYMVMALLLMSVAIFSYAGDRGFSVDNYPYQELSVEEEKSLEYMIQEEKLARDVYDKLYEIWGERIFLNIRNSEQSHIESVKMLMDKYNVENPLESDERGEFRDKEFKDLYNELVEEGSKDIQSALKVGLLIEELDIKDLKEKIAESDNEDIKVVYQNLMKGSRNHLRAFSSKLSNYNEYYEPKYISKEEFYSIANSNKEIGAYIDGEGTILVKGERGKNAVSSVEQKIRNKYGVEIKAIEKVDNGYKVRAIKRYRILGIFDIYGEVSIETDESGEMLRMEEPWWSFLAG